jgi:hypothetical protein
MVDCKRLLELLSKREDYIILIHRNPDGDAVGSAEALRILLEFLGKRAQVLSFDTPPSYLSFLPAKPFLSKDDPLPAHPTFLSVDVAFSIGICTEENPHPHDAYVAARDRLSVLRLMDEQPQEAVVLSRSRPADHMHTEHLQQISDAVLSQDASALKTACSEVLSLYFPPDTDVREAHRRASVFLLRVCSLLAENELHLPLDMPGAAFAFWRSM